VLETSRLILRGWHGRDVQPHAEMSADPEVMRFIGDANSIRVAERLGIRWLEETTVQGQTAAIFALERP